jgi:tRNA threonylcarbamoyladenosine biosynthesis protein TsaB
VIVLALDTALSATSAAVLDGDRVLAARFEPMERGHQERLAGLVRDVMTTAGVSFDALDRIGVTVGPGSFTGLRVGLAFAKGLSIALDVPCVGVGALEALAASVPVQGLVAAVIDARRGQVYLQLFQGGAPLTAPEALTLETAETVIERASAGAPISAIGSGAAMLTPNARLSIDERRFPDPVALARLTAATPEPIGRPEPLYLRAPDAKTIAERGAGQ